MSIKQFILLNIRIVELRTKLVSVSSLLLAAGLVYLSVGYIDYISYALIFLSALCIDMGATAWNTYYDLLWGLDDARAGDHSEERFSKRDPAADPTFHNNPLIGFIYSPSYIMLVALSCFAAGSLFGLTLLYYTRALSLFGLGLAGLLVGYTYSGGPKPISSTPLGELFAGGLLGAVLMYSVFVSQGLWQLKLLWPLIAHSLWIASILSINNACDFNADRNHGRKTLAIVLGRPYAFYLIPVEVAVSAVAWLGFAASLRHSYHTVMFTALIVIAYSITFLAHKKMFRAGFCLANKGFCMRNCMKSFALYTLLLCIALFTIGYF